MIDYTDDRGRFTYRAAGVAIHEGRVLLHTMDDADYWILPGGRVEFGETSREALAREMAEELGQTIQVGRLLWIVESFLMDAGQRVHGLGLYYAMDLAAPAAIRTPFEVMDDGRFRLAFAWHPLAHLATLTVYPPFLHTTCSPCPSTPRRSSTSGSRRPPKAGSWQLVACAAIWRSIPGNCNCQNNSVERMEGDHP